MRRSHGVADNLAGTQDLTIPPFINIDYDTTAKTATLSIEDKTVKQQREMWGEKRLSSLALVRQH